MSTGNLDPAEEKDQIVTQNSIEAHQVAPETNDWKTIKSVSATGSGNATAEAKIEKRDTTLKDNDPAIDNENETIDLAKIQAKVRKQSENLREIGDQATMREIGTLEARERQLSDQRYTVHDAPQTGLNGSFLGEKLAQTDSIIQINPTSSFLIRHNNITTILIDEFDVESDLKDLETTEVSLPRSPMAALILMESTGLWLQLDNFTKTSIYCAIFLTTIIQFVAAGALYFQKFFGDYEVEYGSGIDGVFNVVVMSFVVIYLAQDCARLYKMYILLKHVTRKPATSARGGGAAGAPQSKAPNDVEMGRTGDADAGGNGNEKLPGKGLKRRDIGFLWIFIFSNFLFYIFLLYYAMIETLQTNALASKLQVAISVFFVLELDDWLYNVTIEPLNVIEDSVFNLRIRGNKGSKKKRFRRISSFFWGTFFFVELAIILLFATKSFEKINL